MTQPRVVLSASPLHLDLPNPTMRKKLVINIAPTGAFTLKEQNPNQPYYPKEIAQAVIEAYKQGASVWHVHTRDEKGAPGHDPRLIKETTDMVMDKCPDIITSDNVYGDMTKQGVDKIRPVVDFLKEAEAKSGRKYIQTAVVTPYSRVAGRGTVALVTEPILKDMVTYLQANNIRPEFQIRNYAALKHVEDWLIKPGVLKKPYILNIVLGFHGFDFGNPTTPDPWGHVYLFATMNQLPAGCVVGVTAGGHNWLPITVSGIMMGADCVRVGMEDTIYMYPHKNELIKSSADVVRKVATIARELGRDVATPAEARKILGLKDKKIKQGR